MKDFIAALTSPAGLIFVIGLAVILVVWWVMDRDFRKRGIK